MIWVKKQVIAIIMIILFDLVGVLIAGLIFRASNFKEFNDLVPFAAFINFILGYFALKGNLSQRSSVKHNIVANSLAIDTQKLVEDGIRSTDKSFRTFLHLMITGGFLLVAQRFVENLL